MCMYVCVRNVMCICVYVYVCMCGCVCVDGIHTERCVVTVFTRERVVFVYVCGDG